MIWNCSSCGDLPVSQVSLSEECILCQWPITYRDSVTVPDEVGAAREEREKAEMLRDFNQRVLKG